MDLQTAAANEEGFYGVNESNPGWIVKLTYDWMASNISPAFADNLMRKYKTGGFCEVPPGNSRAEEDKAPLPDSAQTWLDSIPQDALPYQQGHSQTCVFTTCPQKFYQHRRSMVPKTMIAFDAPKLLFIVPVDLPVLWAWLHTSN